ncbi:branched-chain amino acid aminotransferase II [Cryphonectria parasitica EP155]|uniref:Branched-chain amino acid aminotransferase II n=1 Tax=Cryphonectria parasitica (strain ATCC 38755 / EP155) TaxID=660469 RepID=A0A9P4XXL6_CRYP1|nr:branched-chain amino acid aminotransferase II [Cryphonectria parasitica EP155]KAF3762788.1 branched-chain amino acid aminotransferase II [Cryphonectria parasitica EP155]
MPSFPPPPSNTLDWANIGFRMREVNGHIESHYSHKTGQWTPLQFVTDPYIRMHGMAPALNYGQQAYEGLKAFRTPGDKAIQIFRPDRNAVRMQHSAEFVSMPPLPVETFIDACRAAVALNAEWVPPHDTGAAMYVRPQMYGSSAQLGLTPPEEYTFCVYVLPTGVYHGLHPVRCLILDDFDRAAPNGTGSAKVGGNYAPVLRWTDKARSEGYDITLHLDSATHTEIDEFSTSGFIGALVDGDSVTIVVPDSNNVINSVTSESVQGIAESFGWKVVKRPIKYAELADFAEVMAAGTAASLVPIRSITRRMTASDPKSLAATVRSHPRLSIDTAKGEETITYIPDTQEDAGALCVKLLSQLKAIQMGKVEDKLGWCVTISDEDRRKAAGHEVVTNGENTGEVSIGQMD